jgi:16S rRNA (guanine527-N7)-methyltransferase
LAQGLAEIGVSLGERAIQQLLAYAAEVARWRQRVNITGFREPEQIVREGILRSLRLLPLLPEGDRIGLADVGSGAGFPGIPLKVARPDLRVTLIEASRRRASFLSHSIRLLGLEGIVCLRGRVEVLRDEPGIRGAFDVVAARALAPLPEAIALLTPLLAPSGSLLLLQGKRKELPPSWPQQAFHGIEFRTLPGTSLLPEDTVAVIRGPDVSRETYPASLPS